MKILVVDTEKGNSSFLKEKLDARNVLIRTAYGGECAIEMIDQDKYSMVISALEMPHPHGMEIVGVLRAKGLDIPVILLSRFPLEEGDIRRIVASMSNVTVLGRPLRMSILYKTIELLLDAKINWTERRINQRMTIALPTTILYTGAIKFPAEIRVQTHDISMGGLSYLRDVCRPCTGYDEGSVHFDCIFYRYAITNPSSDAVAITLQTGGSSITLAGRVANTRIFDNGSREIIGIKFVDSPKLELQKLREFLKQRAKKGEGT